MIFNDIAFVFGLTGALCSFMSTIILPAACFFKLGPKENITERWFCGFVAIAASVVALLSLIQTIVARNVNP